MRAAICNPKALLSGALSDVFHDPTKVFPEQLSCDVGWQRASRSEDERKQYIQLTLREFRCGKLALRRHVNGGGAVVAIGKASVGKQRKIWHGAHVSACASPPPVPYRLATPASLLELDVEAGEQLYFPKRDSADFLRRSAGTPRVAFIFRAAADTRK